MITPDPDIHVVPSIQPDPVVGENQSFQPNPSLESAQPQESVVSRLGKTKLFVGIAIIIVMLVLGGIAFAWFSSRADPPVTQTTKTSGNATPVSASSETANTTSDQKSNSTATPPSSPTPAPVPAPASPSPQSPPTPPSPSPSPTPPAPSATSHTVDYTQSCFSPANLTIKQGDTVKFTNNSNGDMWPASNNHPSHTIYPEFDASQRINIGGTYSFTFLKIGAWGYHDHLKPSCDGTITVQA